MNVLDSVGRSSAEESDHLFFDHGPLYFTVLILNRESFRLQKMLNHLGKVSRLVKLSIDIPFNEMPMYLVAHEGRIIVNEAFIFTPGLSLGPLDFVDKFNESSFSKQSFNWFPVLISTCLDNQACYHLSADGIKISGNDYYLVTKMG